jgi:hypothetical protein
VLNVLSESREAGDTQPITNVVAFPPNEFYGIIKVFKIIGRTIHLGDINI